MPRHRKGEGLRDRIIDACEAQLAAGPAAVTVRDVAAAAGVSNGTLYHYFPSIHDLLLAAASRASSRQQEAFGDPASVGIAAVIARLFDPGRRDTVLPWLRQRARESPALTAALQQYDRDVNAQYSNAIRQLSGAGPRSDLDVEAAVEVVRALAEGYQLRVASNTLAIDSDRFAAVVLDLIMTAWFQPPPPPATRRR